MRGVPAYSPSPVAERGHHVSGEPTELLDKRRRVDALRPVEHDLVEAGVLCLVLADERDAVGGRADHPRFLGDALPDRRSAGRRAGRSPRPALVVGVPDEAERREPLVAFVVSRLDAPDGLFLRLRHVEAETEAQVLTEALLPAVASARVAIRVEGLIR